MQIFFKKISDLEHDVSIIRQDASSERVRLNTRSFLRHDIAHLAAESELHLQNAYWGSVAQGMSLSGKSIRGKEIGIAESMAVRIQGLLRLEAGPDEFKTTLIKVQPGLVNEAIAENIYHRCRDLIGHWRATPFGDAMICQWLESESGDRIKAQQHDSKCMRV